MLLYKSIDKIKVNNKDRKERNIKKPEAACNSLFAAVSLSSETDQFFMEFESGKAGPTIVAASEEDSNKIRFDIAMLRKDSKLWEDFLVYLAGICEVAAIRSKRIEIVVQEDGITYEQIAERELQLEASVEALPDSVEEEVNSLQHV